MSSTIFRYIVTISDLCFFLPHFALQYSKIPFPTLVTSEVTSHFRAVPTTPVAPARRSKASRGGVWVFPDPSRSPGLTWAIRARAGRCREGGLSSTDERVELCHE